MVSFEFAIRPKLDDLKRFHIKNGLLTASYKVAVVTVIVYLIRGRYRTFPNRYIAQIGSLTTTTTFSSICLWEYKERIRSGEFRELAPLLVLLEEHPTKEIIFEEKALIKEVKDEHEQHELLALAMMVALRKFKEAIIKELFIEEQNMLKEVTFVKEWLQESLAEGREVGREEGREEGRAEGHTLGLHEGQIKIILKQILSILGRVEADLENKIRSLDDANIEKLSEDLLKMKNTADLVQWLRLREKNSKN